MTTLTVPSARVSGVITAVTDAGLPAPSGVAMTPGAAQASITWSPDLTAADQTTVTLILGLAVGSTLITPAERTALDPDFVEMRALRTRTNAQWGALTALQRDTDLIAWCRDITDVLRAILRD